MSAMSTNVIIVIAALVEVVGLVCGVCLCKAAARGDRPLPVPSDEGRRVHGKHQGRD